MSSNMETLDVGQANELKLAFRRNGWNNEQVKQLCEGNILAQILQVLLGNAVIAVVNLLKQVATVVVAGSTKFVAADHFWKDNRGVRISWLGENFKRHFLEKVEKNVQGATLAVNTLLKASQDALILTELGERVETTLAYLWGLLKQQPNGEAGPLLTNGYANIFYIRDARGNVWAVRAYWYAVPRGWNVYAISVGSPVEWAAGSQVFSQAA